MFGAWWSSRQSETPVGQRPRAVEQMHTINSGYFRLVAFWSSSSFFVTISFGDQWCLVTRDRGEGWVSWEWAGGLDVEGLFGWSAPERGMLRVCLWARTDCSVAQYLMWPPETETSPPANMQDCPLNAGLRKIIKSKSIESIVSWSYIV